MIRIITDSTSDISLQQCKEWDIEIAPLKVVFGDETYRDGVNLTKEDFYEKLANAKELPTTSQVNPGEFEDIFKQYIDNGDEIIGIFISSKLSGTYQSALIAKDFVSPEKINIIDSQNATFGLGLLVRQATILRDKGLSAAEITEEIKRLTTKVRLVAMVDTLKYLKKSGRISAASAFVGGVLNIKPLISIANGIVNSIGKEKGKTLAFKTLLSLVKNDEPDYDYPIFFGHTNSHDALVDIMEHFTGNINMDNVEISNIGSTVGTHVGPGAAGIAYISKND